MVPVVNAIIPTTMGPKHHTHTHIHTRTLLKLSDPKHYTHPVLISPPHTQTVTHIKKKKKVQSCCCLILACDLVQVRKCSTGEENDWITRRDWVWVGSTIG